MLLGITNLASNTGFGVPIVTYGVYFVVVGLFALTPTLISLYAPDMDIDREADSRFTWFEGKEKHILVGLLAGAAMAAIAVGVAYVVRLMYPEATGSITGEGLLAGLPLPALVLVLVLCAPIIEETLFRGIIMRGLLSWRISSWLAILVQGAGFALIHIPETLTPVTIGALIYLFLGGILLGIVRWRTGSLVPTVIAHAFYNAFVLVVTLNPSILNFIA
jgi:probable transmembrane protein